VFIGITNTSSKSQASGQFIIHLRPGAEDRLLMAMKSANQYAVVLVTVPDLLTARKLAKTALQKRTAACVNLVPRIESYYWWLKKISSDSEVLLILKTTKAKLGALEKLILANHPYDTPEFLVLNLSKGNQRYLSWLTESVR
jgi:periplasmic divalent cation tolerance protein